LNLTYSDRYYNTNICKVNRIQSVATTYTVNYTYTVSNTVIISQEEERHVLDLTDDKRFIEERVKREHEEPTRGKIKLQKINSEERIMIKVSKNIHKGLKDYALYDDTVNDIVASLVEFARDQAFKPERRKVLNSSNI
jgi:hypothetical protein